MLLICTNMWHCSAMTEHDPLAVAARDVNELEEKLTAARGHLVDVIHSEVRRGIPKAAIAKRVGTTSETIRRWLRRAGYSDSIEPLNPGLRQHIQQKSDRR